VPFLRERLRPAAGVEAKRLGQLIADLDSEQFTARERAAAELERLGERAAPALRQALARQPSAEMRRRAEGLLDRLQGGVTEPGLLRALRAVEALEHAATPEARSVLQELARGEPEARQTREAKAALQRLTKRSAAGP
jgi:hypothetical protein